MLRRVTITANEGRVIVILDGDGGRFTLTASEAAPEDSFAGRLWRFLGAAEEEHASRLARIEGDQPEQLKLPGV